MTLSTPDQDGVRTDTQTSLRVLNLVTNVDSTFYNQQIETLEAQGVSTETLPVPGENKSESTEKNETATRSVWDYARYLPAVMSEASSSYDLLHANYGLTAPAALVQRKLPVVLSLWGSDLMGEYGWMTKRCVPFADAVIVMSERMAAELDRDCYVIPHGLKLDQFQPQPQREAQTELGWPPDVKHVVFPYPPKRTVKNFPRAKRVFQTAAERFDGPVELHTITGVDHSDMPTYLNAADVMLLTSHREGSPNTVKEALACNLPVVATDVGDVPERLDGVTHSTVGQTDRELVDGLVAALEADERSNGREHVQDLTIERMGERIRGVYRDVLAET
ncbi:glycosyltransferase family 4 protein [Halorientalis brevis]|uniref:Glycosyltransferase family 4 protein n=1 Tax=Halorientalis brevis TaxID=1126241 RepID=A0ABD6CED0_9EURY